MSEIILTSSGDREASSTGMSHKSFDAAQEGHGPLVVWVFTLGTHYTSNGLLRLEVWTSVQQYSSAHLLGFVRECYTQHKNLANSLNQI